MDSAVYDAAQYEPISTTDLLVFVAAAVNERESMVTFEKLVVAAYKMFPAKFSLVGFPEYPDASRVGRTLLQCRPKYRNLITGSASSQFVLTELGRERVAEVAFRLAGNGRAAVKNRRSRPRAIVDRMEREILESTAFSSWIAGAEIDSYDLFHLLHLLPGSPASAARENFTAIVSALRGSSDDGIKRFLADVESRYIGEMK